MNIDMKVNELPARTYRWLRLNGENIALDDVTFTRFAIPYFKAPEGVSITTDENTDEEKRIFGQIHEDILKADKGLPVPNGDTSGNHASQLVRTGMGAGIDSLLDEAEVPVRLIRAEAGEHVSEPVVMNEELEKNENVLCRQIIEVPDGADMTVIMDYRSDKDADGIEGISTKFYVGRNAHLNLIKVQMLGKKVRHFDDIGGVVMDDGRFDLVQIELGAARSYLGTYINLLGTNAASTDNTAYLAEGDQFCDFNYVAEQRGVRTDSFAVFRGILKDKAHKNWRGSLDFRKGSMGSVGDEQEDTLLLSPEVVNRTIPLILCGEEDVDGRHGASIGQLSDDMLFYMEARGIDKEEARRIMVRARLDSIVRMVPDGELRKRIGLYLDEIL